MAQLTPYPAPDMVNDPAAFNPSNTFEKRGQGVLLSTPDPATLAMMSSGFSNISFTPTPASIPPPGARLRRKELKNAPVNYHPLVRSRREWRALLLTSFVTESTKLCAQSCSHIPQQSRASSSQCSGARHLHIRCLVLHHAYARDAVADELNRAQRIQNLAYALIKAGVQPGDRVAVIAPNRFVI